MSICGGCPFPYEYLLSLEDVELDEEDEEYRCVSEDGYCLKGCTFQDAVYAAQEAYDLLKNRYNKLEKQYKELLEITLQG